MWYNQDICAIERRGSAKPATRPSSFFTIWSHDWLCSRYELHRRCLAAPLQWRSRLLALCFANWRLWYARDIHGGPTWTYKAQHNYYRSNTNTPSWLLQPFVRSWNERRNIHDWLVLHAIRQSDPNESNACVFRQLLSVRMVLLPQILDDALAYIRAIGTRAWWDGGCEDTSLNAMWEQKFSQHRRNQQSWDW